MSARVPLLLALALLLSACPGSIDDPARFLADADAAVALVDGPAAPDDRPTVDAPTPADAASPCVDYVERTLFPQTCATVYCHAATEPAAGLDLASPELARRVVGVRGSMSCRSVPLVDPAHPEASLMVVKLRAAPGCGSRMPLGGTALTASQVECVRVWAAGLAATVTTDAGAQP